ncbi:MAG: T9SS type A sorting domain-containing protein [Ignavibacteria bacterium]
MVKKFIVGILLLLAVKLYAQESIFVPKGPNNPVITDRTDGVSSPVMTKSYVPSQREQELIARIKSLREQNLESNRDEITRLNNELNSMQSNLVTAQYTPYNGSIQYASNLPMLNNEDNPTINATRLFTNTKMKCMATATETRGANAGRIWVFAGFYSGNASAPDSARLLYSANNGMSWVVYAYITLGGTDRFNTDEADMEIIESGSGNSYIWIVYGLTANNGTGKVFSGGAVITTPTFGGALYAFSWPGDDPAKKYYSPRITSDNSYYFGSAYTYIAISFDSATVCAQKFAVCVNPYTTTPTFTYKADKIWWFTSSHSTPLHTDLAFFRNTNDSLIFVYSNVPDSTKLFFSKMSTYSPYVGQSAGSSIGGSEATSRKSYARLATNSNDNGAIIVSFRQYDITNNNWRAKYFRTTNFSFTGSFAQSELFGSTTASTYAPDIMGKRGTNTIYLSMIHWGSGADSLQYVTITSTTGVWPVNITKMNPSFLLTAAISPKPGFRNVANDSCFVIYNETGPYHIWASFGCSGAVTAIGNNVSAPDKYELLQNYPNPFNPITAIKFSLPKDQLVKLSIYDITGKEVAVLVNEVKKAGSYIVEFNAGNLASGVYFYKLTAGEFSSVKKMMLVK